MADERLASSLQLSVLAALCFDQGWGASIAAQVSPEHFDNVWRDFAAQVLSYRRRYGRPPGDNYIGDLAARATVGKDDALLQRRLIPELLVEAEGLNAEYAASRVNNFVRGQVLKGALFEAGDRYAQVDERTVEDVEAILFKALRSKQQTMGAGTFINDTSALRYLTNRPDVVSLGIPELDRLRIGLITKQLLLYIAPKGTGKTWFCIHCAKQAILQRLKVAHYSLEMDETQIIPRYYQSLFGIAQDGERYNRTSLEFDDLGRLSGFKSKLIRPKLDMTQPGIIKLLRNKMNSFGVRLGGLLIKSFPTGQLTLSQLVGHLDYLAEVENFVPNVLIVDYPKLMKMDPKNVRIELGHNMEGLRGVASERNMALVAPHQGGRATFGAKRTRSKDAGEDISVVQTGDTVLAYSRTEAEEERGLGRLSVEHSRASRGGQQILLAQSYETGQYVLNSAPMQKAYWDRLRELGDGGDDEDS